MRIYLDASPVIFMVERTPQQSWVQSRLSQPGTLIVTSTLTRMECLIKPLRSNDQKLISEFEGFFTLPSTEFLDLSGDVVNRAARIRATHNFRTPDALHLAAAVINRCDAILTNDQQLKRFTSIAVELIP